MIIMPRKHNFKIWAVAVGCVFFMWAEAYGSPRINYPGTRGKGMGMAFTAIADDASAVWYNPAGLLAGDEGFDFIAEGGELIGAEFDTKIRPFVAFSWNSGEGVGVVFSWYYPYAFGYTAHDFYDYGDIFNDLLTKEMFDGWEFNRSAKIKDLRIFGMGIAYEVLPGIRIGGVLESLELKTNSDKHEAGSFTAGVHWTLVDNRPLGLKAQLGAAYRLKSNFDEEYEIFNKPESWNFGVAVMKSFITLPSAVTLSVQYEKTDYSKISSEYDIAYDMLSYGIELQLIRDNSQFSRIALRAGAYSETPDEGVGIKMNGRTSGIGILLGESWGIGYAVEWRKLTHQDFAYSKNFTLHALSVTWTPSVHSFRKVRER